MGLKAVSVSRMLSFLLFFICSIDIRYVAVSFTWYAMQGAHYYATFHMMMGGNLAGGRGRAGE